MGRSNIVQCFQMESAPDLQMTIVLTSCLPYKMIFTDAISAIAMEAIKKRNTLNITVLGKESSTLSHFLGMIGMKLIESYFLKNGIRS